MKRSRGVTAMAILFILWGGLGVAGTVMTPWLRDMQERQMTQEMDSFRQTLSKAKGEKEAAQNQKIMRAAEEMFQATKAYSDSPAMIFIYSLLSPLLLIGGIGVLRLKAWGRVMVLWTVGASLVEKFWFTIAAAPLREKAHGLTFYGMSGTLDPASEKNFLRMVEIAQAADPWIGFLIPLAWSGFVIWFFNRASVKAQFQHSP